MLVMYSPQYCAPCDFSKNELKELDKYSEIPEKIHIVNNELQLLFYPYKLNMTKLLAKLDCDNYVDKIFGMNLYSVYNSNQLVAYRLMIRNKNLWIIL